VIVKPPLVLTALGLLLTSSCITEPLCACSPPGGGTAVITGTVGDPRSAPVEGASIRIRVVHDGTCEEPSYTVTRAVASDAAGRFRHTESWSGGRKCFRVWAEPPQGSALSASEPQNVRIDFLDAVIPDSVDLRITLR
jgi:hypothetical protein